MTAGADWPPGKIKAAIYAKGFSMEALAIANGRSSAIVRVALRQRCPTGERIVAGLLFFEHGSQKLLGFPPGMSPPA